MALSTNVAAAPLRIRPPPLSDGKLDETNYTLWKFKMSAILDSYELLETIMGPTGGVPEPMVTFELHTLPHKSLQMLIYFEPGREGMLMCCVP